MRTYFVMFGIVGKFYLLKVNQFYILYSFFPIFRKFIWIWGKLNFIKIHMWLQDHTYIIKLVGLLFWIRYWFLCLTSVYTFYFHSLKHWHFLVVSFVLLYLLYKWHNCWGVSSIQLSHLWIEIYICWCWPNAKGSQILEI